MKKQPRVVALVPAHDEQDCIEQTLRALLAQNRLPDLIVIVCDNCTDATHDRAATVARTAPEGQVLVLNTPDNTHRKPGALNWAWNMFCRNADLVVTLDADTVLPPNAVGDWEQEFIADPRLGGSSSKFTMPASGHGGGNLLVRLQRAEFARWTMTGLRRGWTSVLAGTGCCIRNSLLASIAVRRDRVGPWTYKSAVEDFELTYRIRELGYRCRISPTVRAYTDAMTNVKALWAQRMKWQMGTCEDLLTFGVNKLTIIDWWQQAAGVLAALVRVGWVSITLLALAFGILQFHPIWLLPTLVFIANDTRQAWRIPHRDKWDVLMAFVLIPAEVFAWLRAAWFTKSWWLVMRGQQRDLWATQIAVEKTTR